MSVDDERLASVGRYRGVLLAPEDAERRWGYPQGLVDDGAQVLARSELGSAADVDTGRESGSDLSSELVIGFWVARQVEENPAHGG